MELGLGLPGVILTSLTPPELAAMARVAEARGFASLWVGDHVLGFKYLDWVQPPEYSPTGEQGEGGLDCFEALAFMAAVTSRIRLGVGVCIVPQRNPVYTAKSVTGIDGLSQGRFDFGIGVGWNKDEFEACEAEFDARGKRCDSYIELMRVLWTERVSSYKSDYYELAPCRMNPKPVQKPHPPIYIGGDTDPALRRAAKYGDGWYASPQVQPADFPARLARLAEFAAGHGRRRSDLRIVGAVSVDEASALEDAVVDSYAAAGVDHLVLVARTTTWTLQSMLDLMDRAPSKYLRP